MAKMRIYVHESPRFAGRAQYEKQVKFLPMVLKSPMIAVRMGMTEHSIHLQEELHD